ncbi:hypothetical protein OG21DRAFT_1486446 [Imleria badia]|nr:hypothetical protein OG21DRAFT_1486446 [Imleria badia]
MSLSTHPSVYLFSNREYDLLNKFSRTAWGHPKFLFKTLDASSTGVFEFIDLGEYFTVFRVLFAGIVRHPRILVRDEYRVALDALQGNKAYDSGAYVIGHPGIGKTIFLVYLIIHCLGQKQAVGFQLPSTVPSLYAFFSEEGVSIQSLVDSRPISNCPSFIWALCDAAYHAVPSPIFMGHPDRIRIIQTTAPESSHYRLWSRQLHAEPFVMDIWSIEEIRTLAIMLNLDADRMTELATKWGGVPQTLLYFLTNAKKAENEIRSTAKKAVRECHAMLLNAELLNLPDNAFYFIRPEKTPEGTDHMLPRVSVPTPTLCSLLAEALGQESHTIKLDFFRALSRLEGTRQTAGDIYKSWLHSFISMQGTEIECEWLLTLGLTRTQNLQGTASVISTTQTAPAAWKPPFYWVPSTRNFPGIDSALISRREIVAIRVVTADRHHSPPETGLMELSSLLPSNHRDLSWNLLFVGMDNESGLKINANSYDKKIDEVHVGWSVIDPVQEGVIYREFGDVSDPAANKSVKAEE